MSYAICFSLDQSEMLSSGKSKSFVQIKDKEYKPTSNTLEEIKRNKRTMMVLYRSPKY